jgi:NAD(P)-dependent dehydrogenase (short-subunit alcohol dehydrogenase family)
MKLDYFDLTGKVAVVSGGSTGIGRGICEGLSEAGAQIVFFSPFPSECEEGAKYLKEKTGAEVAWYKADVRSRDDMKELVGKVVEKFGHIDIVVNSAGVGGPEKPIMKIEDDEKGFDFVLDINLTGAYNLTKAAVKPMIERGQGGRIIHVVSVGSMIAYSGMAGYCASKGGLMQLTKVMALEWSRYNINVNAILPGYIETPMNSKFFSSDAGQGVINRNIPMKRLGKPGEMKGVAVLLASDASSFMTGSAVVVDGGNVLW